MLTIKRQATHIAITVIIIVCGLTAAALLATQLKDPPPFALEVIIFLAGGEYKIPAATVVFQYPLSDRPPANETVSGH